MSGSPFKVKFLSVSEKASNHFSYFVIPFSICYAITMIAMGFATHFVDIKDQPLFEAIQKTDLNGLFLLVGSVIGSIGIRSADKRPIAGALFCAFVLVFTSMVLRMVPPDVRFEALGSV